MSYIKREGVKEPSTLHIPLTLDIPSNYTNTQPDKYRLFLYYQTTSIPLYLYTNTNPDVCLIFPFHCVWWSGWIGFNNWHAYRIKTDPAVPDKSRETPLLWCYVHENSPQMGFHTHMMICIPQEIIPSFRKYICFTWWAGQDVKTFYNQYIWQLVNVHKFNSSLKLHDMLGGGGGWIVTFIFDGCF